MYNSKKHKNKSSRFKGVVKRVYKCGKVVWRSSIKCEGVSVNLGTFNCEIEAYKAYLEKAFEIQGEYMSNETYKDYLKYVIKEEKYVKSKC